MKFEQKVTSTNTGKIICPDLEQFKDEDNNQPEVHWYKVLNMCISYIQGTKSVILNVLWSNCEKQLLEGKVYFVYSLSKAWMWIRFVKFWFILLIFM